MTAIIAGKRRGAKLLVPEGLGVRPTLVRVREALFSMLTSEFGSLEGIRVLDPFAGAGMLGLEAWSRGAVHVDFIEIERSHFQILCKNINTLRANNEVTAIQGQSPQIWHRLQNSQYDLVLCDPPYAAGLMPKTLQALLDLNLLKNNAVISVELNAQDELLYPDGFSCFKNKNYGKCKICLLKKLDKSSSSNEP